MCDQGVLMCRALNKGSEQLMEKEGCAPNKPGCALSLLGARAEKGL